MGNSIADYILKGESPEKKSMFIHKTANEWIEEASTEPEPNMLFSELWHEGELCILFADTNVGKSILAVQIADIISRGKGDNIFKVEAEKQKVLYYDFELSKKQFQNRYSENYHNSYEFDKNFIRLELDTSNVNPNSFEQELFENIENHILEQGAKVLVIDNISFLKTQSTDTAKEALPLMNMLINLKKKHKVSILVLAHTPKIDQSRPITVNQIAGSKHLSNFVDSIFAIGQSIKEPSLRYIKQIKARATEKIYDSDYVIVCRIEKPYNFLKFTFIGFEVEREHLKERTDRESAELDNLIIETFNSNPTLKLRDIARSCNTYHQKVSRLLKKHGLINGTCGTHGTSVPPVPCVPEK